MLAVLQLTEILADYAVMSAEAMRDTGGDEPEPEDGEQPPLAAPDPPQVLSFAQRILPAADFPAETFIPAVELAVGETVI